nr:hypothetical protein [Tanacetum cinerariifolium]
MERGDSDDESDGYDDACVEILLVTLIRYAVVIPSSRNQGGSSIALTVEDSQGKGIMADDATASSVGVSRLRPSSSLVPLFRDVFGDAIHVDFFPFFIGPYYATYPEVSTLKKQVFGLNDKLSSSNASFAKSKAKGKESKKKIKSLIKCLENLHAEVARLSTDLNRATILEAEKDEEILRLKATPLEVQGELISFVSSDRFERGLSMHQTKDEFVAVLK